MDPLTINLKDFYGNPIISHRSVMDHLSKCNSIYISVVNDELVQILNYCENFIYPLNHNTHITESGVQDTATWSVIGRSDEDISTLVSLRSIYIAPINYDILKKIEGRKRKGNMHMKTGVGNKRQTLSLKSKRQASSGAEKSLSRFHP